MLQMFYSRHLFRLSSNSQYFILDNVCKCQQYVTLMYVIILDDCAAEPCLNGATCTDLTNAYVCQCAAGYSGANCETGEYFQLPQLPTRRFRGKTTKSPRVCLKN